MFDVIIGLKLLESKRDDTQYHMRLARMLEVASGSDLAGISWLQDGNRRHIKDGDPCFHIMRILYPHCVGGFYKVTQQEFELMLLPFTDKILCYHELDKVVAMAEQISSQRV